MDLIEQDLLLISILVRDDFFLSYLLEFVTKNTFINVPLVSKRWGKFKTYEMWQKRLKQDWGVDVLALKQKPTDVVGFSRSLHTMYRETVRRAENISVVHMKNTKIRMRARMFSF